MQLTGLGPALWWEDPDEAAEEVVEGAADLNGEVEEYDGEGVDAMDEGA